MPENALIPLDRNTPEVVVPAEQNPALVYLASLGSNHSRRAMRHALEVIAGMISSGQADALTLPWHLLRFQHTAAIRAQLADRFKFSTANNMLSALRGVLKTAADLELMSADECRSACNWKPVRGESVIAGRDLQPGEITALVRVCKEDKTPSGARDVAMIGILYTCGMRRSELVALDLADYEPATGKLTIRSGKGNKARTVYAANGAQLALEVWLLARGSEDGLLFCAINKSRRLTGQRMSTQAIYIILKKRADQADVKGFSPHDFRRTFVGEMLDRGADIATVQKLAGHASPTTTGRYDRRNEETKRKAANLLHFPF